jgi:adenylate cyclase
MTRAVPTCRICGNDLRANAKFCDECGGAVNAATPSAEYKQVTVLFADVVHSMDIAARVGAERMREIVVELVTRATDVVHRFGGKTDAFTGDGIMAVFGVPAALEDHALRGCLAALAIQQMSEDLAAEVSRRDHLELQLRVGLNSGQVVAADGGSGPLGHTAIGEQVGLAQRMESVAPPGGVLISESTARLVEDAAVLGEAEMVNIKGAAEPVLARRLVAIPAHRRRTGAPLSSLVGREAELDALSVMLSRSTKGSGSVAGLVGPAGIGKSRLITEIEDIAVSLRVQVFSTYCESHATEIPFSAVARLLRGAFGINELDDEDARTHLRAQLPGVDPSDLVLLEDTLGVRDPDVEVADIGPDARRRRLTEVVNAASLARSAPAVYVIEDVHWIDQTSEALLTDFLSVVPQTHSLVVIAYRPEYRGALTRTPGAQTIALAPLDDSQTEALISELLGPHPTVAGLTAQIAERAGGNPFFAEEIVRDLADRNVLTGARGAYVGPGSSTDVSVPATLQVAIAARIDRLDPEAKRTLNAAAVIGMRFGADLLACLSDTIAMGALIDAELVDQVMETPRAEYAFRHPLIRTVAYRSQLRAERADLHHRLAAAIQQHKAESLDENAALIAEHLESAGDLHEAFRWHMRAGEWLTTRDLFAARVSWQKACQVSDQLPGDEAERTPMRIAPRALLCVTAWRAVGTVSDTGFEELRSLAETAGDKMSLAIGMAGQVIWLFANGWIRESSALSSDCVALIESIDDSVLTLGLLYPVMPTKYAAGEVSELLRLAERVIDLADGDPNKGNIVGSPLGAGLTFRAAARCFLGDPTWKDDIEQMVALVDKIDLATGVLGMMYKCVLEIVTGGIVPDETALPRTAEILRAAERSGDDYVLAAARCVRGYALMQLDGRQRRDGLDLLDQFREAIVNKRFSEAGMPLVELATVNERARSGDTDGAIEQSRALVESEFDSGEMIYLGTAVNALVEVLLQRGTDADVREAAAAVERLAAAPTEPGFVMYDVVLLRMRALLARARGDLGAYGDYVGRYRAMATSLGFEGHIATSGTMT